MKALLLFGLLALFAAGSLMLNVALPDGFRLILVPVFAVVLVLLIVGRAFRRES